MTPYILGSGWNARQWAAVTIHSGWIRDAPHLWFHFPSLSWRMILACQGQECGIASSPPITRGSGGLRPQSVVKIYFPLNKALSYCTRLVTQSDCGYFLLTTFMCSFLWLDGFISDLSFPKGSTAVREIIFGSGKLNTLTSVGEDNALRN